MAAVLFLIGGMAVDWETAEAGTSGLTFLVYGVCMAVFGTTYYALFHLAAHVAGYIADCSEPEVRA